MNQVNRRVLDIVFLAATFLAFAAVGNAQSGGGGSLIFEVKFIKGSYVHTGIVSNPSLCTPARGAECPEDNTTSLILKATRGERIRITLTSDTGDAVFSILTPGDKPLNTGMLATSWYGMLPSSGEYHLYVFTNKESARYTLTITKLKRN